MVQVTDSGFCMGKIYLMRHSQAAPSDFRSTDEARWLTSQGRAIAREAGRALAKELSGQCIDTIVSSPLSRTVQTSELVAQAFDWHSEIHCLSALRSESSPRRAIDELLELPGNAILAVTHEPIVSSMCALMCGEDPRELRSGFKPAEIACISAGEVSWRWRA